MFIIVHRKQEHYMLLLIIKLISNLDQSVYQNAL